MKIKIYKNKGLIINLITTYFFAFACFIFIKIFNVAIFYNGNIPAFKDDAFLSFKEDTTVSYYDKYSSPEFYSIKLNMSNEKYKNIYMHNEEIAKKNITNHLHEDFKYKKVNTNALKQYLAQKNSILVEEPYFSTIMDTAKNFNLNPLLLFAITGQEQGFVPKNNPHCTTIANNPFNIFNSWQNYNTDIEDASQIVSRTVVNLSLNRPEDEDPFRWLNQKYSEDESWFKGVKSIYSSLEKSVPYIE
ncbi:glucosaminidase domain-containing protein [Clostridium sp. ATCC 25772]|uniref:glucosaminidase domain-containing protein n=1 Tax=Clostridium sp. ATCC 25772 TaxID=1676991 RepID=UPI0007861140|nr:glucosaminidase domain-containing protein [Clostridium sp. ATCC 25772]